MERKVERLIKQFPYLDRIIPAEMVGSPTHVEVKVLRADSSHMYWRATEVDGVNRYICRDGKDHVGTRSEHVYLVNGESAWRAQDDHATLIDTLNHRSNPDRWNAVVFASCEHWHLAPNEAERASYRLLGDFVENELTISILQAPREGFSALVASTDLLSNVRLSMPTILDFSIRADKRFERLNEALDRLACEFEHMVYDKGLRELIAASKVKGMSGMYDDVKLMTWVMCGRIMMTFTGLNGRQVTLVGSDGEDLHPGVQSIDATLDEAKGIIRTVIKVWGNTAPTDRQELHHDDEQVRLF